MNQKYIAIFLAVIMVMSILTLFIPGNSNQANGDSSSIEAASFDSIPGKHVDYELNSLSDGLTVTAEDAVVVQYSDIQAIRGTPLELITGNTSQLDGLYGAQVNKVYIAQYIDETGFYMNEISPQVVAFPYYLSPDLYNGYQLLSRGNNVYDVVGEPMLFGDKVRLEQVLDSIEENEKTISQFDRIMEFVEPGAQRQLLIIPEDSVADQYYFELKMLDEMNYSRTNIYLNPTNGTIENVTALADNSSERNLVYDVYFEDDILKTTITSDLSGIYSLAMEPAW
ncbi:hypothetical protein SAMN04488587_1581 [Methanococcoides vulcani]|uniref:Uncharacterized protein n=1 Tax=Methanococcoides vulcani TaxID=1353158 RepID=A0A1I0ACX4_9EURY|nr:hypothetical protein [Methanococcoides vulcani]SES92079.1 hypothetical protein SAMN04488587_1581 [Methanococcoides vulcani]